MKTKPIHLSLAFEVATYDQVAKAKAALKTLFPRAKFSIDTYQTERARRRRRR